MFTTAEMHLLKVLIGTLYAVGVISAAAALAMPVQLGFPAERFLLLGVTWASATTAWLYRVPNVTLSVCGNGPAQAPPEAGCAGAYFDSSTCSKSRSTGVARPKIETETLTRFLSKSNSSTTPVKLAKGPSSTFTESPIS